MKISILRIAIILLVVFQGYHGFSQQTLALDTSFRYLDYIKVADMVKVNDLDLVISGITDTTEDQSMIWLRKIRTTGDSIWSTIHQFDSTVTANNMIMTHDSMFIIAGSWDYHPAVFKFDFEGVFKSMFTLPLDSSFFKDVIEMSNGDLVVIQSKEFNRIKSRVTRFDTAGNIIWSHPFIAFEYGALAYYDEEKFYVSGCDNNLNYPHPIIKAYSVDGDSLFRETFNQVYGRSYYLYIDSNIVYLGNQKDYLLGGHISMVIRSDLTGQYYWYTDIDKPTSPVVRSLLTYNTFVITCSEHNVTNPDYDKELISVVNSEGTYDTSYAIKKRNPIVASMERVDNFAYVTGSFYVDTIGRLAFFNKIDLDSLLIYTPTSINNLISQSAINIYPNPAGNNIYIDLPEGLPESGMVARIFSQTGELVKTVKLAGNNRNELNLNRLSNGIYFVIIDIPDKQPITKKIIVLH